MLVRSVAVWWLALTKGVEVGDGEARLVPEVEALVALEADLDRRLATMGLDGLAGAVDVYRRVRHVLDGVSVADVEGAMARVREFATELGEVARRLERLRALKELLD